MSKSTQQLRRVVRRANNVCGLHLGGCGKVFEKRELTRDHIIPRSFRGRGKGEFNEDWNVQPMCISCNNGKGGQLTDWPLFKCHCHYLQVHDDGSMYVHETTRANERTHLLLAGVAGDGTRFRMMPSRFPRHPNEKGEKIGYAAGKAGHIMPPFPRSRVLPFNWFERARVGKAAGTLVSNMDGKTCTFLPNGRIVPGTGDYWCARRFDPSIGHLNCFYNSFEQGDCPGLGVVSHQWFWGNKPTGVQDLPIQAIYVSSDGSP